MTVLSEIRQRLISYHPEVVDDSKRRRAAVSLILTEGAQGAEVLFIERARRAEDPWSGQMAFPGGRREQGDATLLATAQRETLEEVGLRLCSSCLVGRLDDIVSPKESPAHGLVVSCYVFELLSGGTISTNSEVHDTVWIPVSALVDPEKFTSDYRPNGYSGTFPGIRVSNNDPRVIWGLTYRFLCRFFNAIEPKGVQHHTT